MIYIRQCQRLRWRFMWLRLLLILSCVVQYKDLTVCILRDVVTNNIYERSCNETFLKHFVLCGKRWFINLWYLCCIYWDFKYSSSSHASCCYLGILCPFSVVSKFMSNVKFGEFLSCEKTFHGEYKVLTALVRQLTCSSSADTFICIEYVLWPVAYVVHRQWSTYPARGQRDALSDQIFGHCSRATRYTHARIDVSVKYQTVL